MSAAALGVRNLRRPGVGAALLSLAHVATAPSAFAAKKPNLCKPAQHQVIVRFTYGSEKAAWIYDLTEAFNAEAEEGRPVPCLSMAKVDDPGVRAFVEKDHENVVHYGASTGFYADKMINGGPQYADAAVLYETDVIQANHVIKVWNADNGTKPFDTVHRAGVFVPPSPRAGTAGLQSAPEIPDDLRVFVMDPEGVHAYPIVTYTWPLLRGRYEDAGLRDALKATILWELTEGQQIAEDMGYLALPAEMVALAQTKVEAIQ